MMIADIWINSDLIAKTTIQNQTGLSDSDSVNTYEWSFFKDRTTHRGTVSHLYGDGAVVLLQKVFQDIVDTQSSVHK